MTTTRNFGAATGLTQDRLTLWPVVLALFGSAILAMLVAAAPRPGTPMGVIFPPWTDRGDILQRIVAADGVLLDLGRVAGVAVAVSETPNFAARLRAQGALIVMDGTLTAALCGTRP